MKIRVPKYIKEYGQSDPQPHFLINEEDFMFTDDISIVTGNIVRVPGETVGEYKYSCNNLYAGENYKIRILSIENLEIKKATPIFNEAPYAMNINYGETLQNSVIIGEANIEGNFLWTNASIMPTVYNSNITLYDAIFVPIDINNFNIVELSLNLGVLPRKIDIAFVGDTSLIYDGSDKITNFTAKAMNVFEDDEVIVDIMFNKDFLIDAGIYTAQTSISNYNYIIEGKSIFDIRIFKSEITVSIDNQTITEGDNYEPIISYSGFKGKDNLVDIDKMAELKSCPTEAGVYHLYASGAEDNNYSFKYNSGTLTINKSIISQENITVKGSFPEDFEITILPINENENNFKTMSKYIEQSLQNNEDYKDHIVDKYEYISYPKQNEEEIEFSIKLSAGQNDSLAIYHNDGSIEIIEDYKNENGFVVFSSSNVEGIAVLREASFIEKYELYIIIVAISVLAIVFFVFYIKLKVKNKKKKMKKTPVYYD